MLPSYPQVYAMGHIAIDGILADTVTVTEKIDGSQFSFGLIDGEYHCRSKGQDQTPPKTDKMFQRAVDATIDLPLTEGFIYRGELLNSPHHNAITYSRVPEKYIILFDIDFDGQHYLPYKAVQQESIRLGFEVVPLLYEGSVTNIDLLLDLLNRGSCLGGTTIEGFVIKNYTRFGKDKKVLMGKYVREDFKEINDKVQKRFKSSNADILELLVLRYKTETRWQKAVQHLRDGGLLEGSPRDIGPLMKEVIADVEKECVEEIKDQLYRWAWPKIERQITRGLPEWYKLKLLEFSFKESDADLYKEVSDAAFSNK
ncbi:hypothetical protein HYZ97_02385 [Candidatus Pacearchaeota archaeon]|nr:hypothetical protein [Candidatus Pacearchaeota archaeon]